MNIATTLVLTIIVTLLSVTTSFAAPEKGWYEMGVFPNMPAAKLQELFEPLAAELSQAVGKNIRVSSKPTFEAFAVALNQEYYDIAHVQTFASVEAHAKHN